MLGSFLSGALTLVLGYVYPAYACYKMVELNKPQIEQLRFWCQYWILVAALTVFDRVGESFISWLPMYSEAKLALFIYLWYPKTRGTSYVYETFFRPYVAKHEPEIDRNLVELRTRAGDMIVQYSKSILSYSQTRIFEILQYVASQSASQSSIMHPTQEKVAQHKPPSPRKPIQKARQTTSVSHQAHVPTQPTVPQQHARSLKNLIEEETTATETQTVPSSTINKNTQPRSTSVTANIKTSTSINASMPSSLESTVSVSATSATATSEAMQVDALIDKSIPATPQEASLEEAVRITRARLRKRFAPSTESQ